MLTGRRRHPTVVVVYDLSRMMMMPRASIFSAFHCHVSDEIEFPIRAAFSPHVSVTATNHVSSLFTQTRRRRIVVNQTGFFFLLCPRFFP